jgi:hypothetical protein
MSNDQPNLFRKMRNFRGVFILLVYAKYYFFCGPVLVFEVDGFFVLDGGF